MPMGRRQVDLIRLGFHLGQACEVCTQNISWLYDVRLRALYRILIQFELDVANTIAAVPLRRCIEATISATDLLRDNALAEINQRGQDDFFVELLRLSHSLREPIRSSLSPDERNYFRIGELLAESQRKSDAVPELLNLQERLTARGKDGRLTERELNVQRDLLKRIVDEELDPTRQQLQPFKYRNAEELRKLLKPHGVILEELSRGPNAAMAASSDGRNCEVVPLFDYPVDRWGHIDAYLLGMRPIDPAESSQELVSQWLEDPYFKIEIDKASRQARISAKDVPVRFSEAEWAVFNVFVKSRGFFLETSSILRELNINDQAYRKRKASVRQLINNLGLEFKQEGSRENARHRMQIVATNDPQVGI